MAQEDTGRRQIFNKEYHKELLGIIKSVLFCEFLVHFKIYRLCNGIQKKLRDPLIYESLRAYNRIEWIYESQSGKITCLLNLGLSFALMSLYVDYRGDLIPKCKVVISDSRQDLLTTLLSANKYKQYLNDTLEHIDIVIEK